MDFEVIENPVSGESNNCVVIALHLAAGIPYNRSNELCLGAGRKFNEGFYLDKLFKYVRKNGITFRKIPIGRITLKKFLLKYPKGRFVVERYGHAFSIIDGKIYDTLKNGERCVLFNCYKLKNHRIDTIRELVKKKR